MKKKDDLYFECGKCGKETPNNTLCPYCRSTSFNVRRRSEEEQKDKTEKEIYERLKKEELDEEM